MVEIGKNISKAINYLNDGEIIAIPTETVYGLAGNALNEQAVREIYTVKQRPLFNPLIIHIASKNELSKYVIEIPKKANQLIEAFWPGPLTLLLRKKDIIPSITTSGKTNVAIRVPNHPLTLELLQSLSFPLAAPSANPFGYISPTMPEHVEKQIGNKIPYILDGGICTKGIESSIIGFKNGQPILYRHGSITQEEIENVIGPIKQITKNEISPEAPGMLLKHYSPNTQTFLTDNIKKVVNNLIGKKIGLLLFDTPIYSSAVYCQEILSKKSDLEEAAKNLYAALHRLDNSNLDIIIAERFPDIGLGKTINDKLERASK